MCNPPMPTKLTRNNHIKLIWSSFYVTEEPSNRNPKDSEQAIHFHAKDLLSTLYKHDWVSHSGSHLECKKWSKYLYDEDTQQQFCKQK
jgi:hypothetical protein